MLTIGIWYESPQPSSGFEGGRVQHSGRVAVHDNSDYIGDLLLSYKNDDMLRNRLDQAETLTFRIAPELKAAFAEIAETEEKSIGELLRELIRQRVNEQRRREFETEARRQSREAAAAALDPGSDEAEIMDELEENLREYHRLWK